MRPVTHPLINHPRRLYVLEDGRYLLVGGIPYNEDGCECGKTGIKQAASVESEVELCLTKVEELERKHAGR